MILKIKIFLYKNKMLNLTYHNKNQNYKKSCLLQIDINFSPSTQIVEGTIQYHIALSGINKWVILPIINRINCHFKDFMENYYLIHSPNDIDGYHLPDMSKKDTFKSKDNYIKTEIYNFNIPEEDGERVFSLLQEKIKPYKLMKRTIRGSV